MRYLLLALILLSSCNADTRISTENAIVVFQSQKKMVDALIKDPAISQALQDIPSNPLKTIHAIGSLADSGSAALIPVRKILELQSTVFGFKVDKVSADITVAQVVANPDAAIAVVDFRTKLANHEVTHSLFNTILSSPYMQLLGGIGTMLVTAATAYFGINKFSGVKKLLTSALTESEEHKKVAKNAIYYAKDMEELADKELGKEQRASAIREARTRSIADQNTHSLNQTMDTLLGEVKRERKI